MLAVIPARGGSKGLPKKNITDIAGKPLIAWTIEASLRSKYITKTVVSSDDKEILDIAKQFGADALKRPKNLATDLATSESVVEWVIEHLAFTGELFDIVVLLQPTSPLRDYKDIDKAFEVMIEERATAVISVYAFDNKILKTFLINENGFMDSISKSKFSFMRRQDLPETYMANGAIYIININSFKDTRCFMTDKTTSYVMPVETSRDIDGHMDLKHCAAILKKKNEI